ncbi:MAG: hypothetical protein A7315_00905 [Candidatus Altiarchaeales archaeon WOR_SM1_79]|nr:MAG: hypothetical protein A7315_00905 [Candidatus Altiarchaeales archaeon WOR_SM1_79]
MVKISVVVPCYNAERYIVDCLESVFKQTKEPHEVIVIDDGSTDNTKHCAFYQMDNKTTRIFSNYENKGIGQARYVGVAEALRGKCDYIAFLSTDDAWQPNFLEVMCAAAAQNPDKIIYSGFTICNEQLIPSQSIIPMNFNLRQEDFHVWCYQLALRDNMNVNFSSILIPREVFDKVQFDPELRFGEDLDFLLRSMLYFDYFLVEQALVKIRTHPGSMTSQKMGEIHENNKGIIERFKVEMKKAKE